MSSISQLLTPHIQDLGGFAARRSLPHDERMMIGPFIFFDHLGPAIFPPGKGVDVRPHPHINLATVTYLFEGVLLHRDSLGNVQEIHPGAVNWMSAGRGIVHSERSPQSDRLKQSTLHAIQTWVALPEAHEDTEPWFRHHPTEDIPTWTENGVAIALIAGAAWGRTSPVKTLSPTIYLDLSFAPGAKLTLPADYSERAIYSVTQGLFVDGEELKQHQLAILSANSMVEISTNTQARCVVIGGEPVGDRHKWWNFVSSRPERIEQAKHDWQENRFDQVPEESEFIPLPQDAFTANDNESNAVQPLS
ncbi:MAG: pirin family protein [Nodularia sp. CChRGM 3473]